MSQFIPWLRSHSGAILATAITVSQAHLIPKWIGDVASVVATLCGASN